MRKLILTLLILLPDLVFACSCKTNSYLASWEESLEIVHVTIMDRESILESGIELSEYYYDVNRSYKTSEIGITGRVKTKYIPNKFNCAAHFEIGQSFILFIPKDRFISGCGIPYIRSDSEPMSYLEFDKFIAYEEGRERLFRLFKRSSYLSKFAKDPNLSKLEVLQIEEKVSQLKKEYEELKENYYR